MSRSLSSFSLRGFLYASTFLVGVASFALPSTVVYAACTPSNTGTAGPDTITCDAGNIAGAGDDISGRQGDDVITLNAGDAQNVFGNEDNDQITLNGTHVSGNIEGGDGDDTLSLQSGLVGGGIMTPGSVLGGAGKDGIILQGATVSSLIDGGDDDDQITLVSGTVGMSVLGGIGTDKITLEGATVMGSLDGGDGDDVIEVLSAGQVANVLGGTGNDTITIDGGHVYGNVEGGDGDDSITIKSGGVVDYDVLGGIGNDTITIDRGHVYGNVEGGDGNDSITVQSGGLVDYDVLGGIGNDTITIDGGHVYGNVNGGDGINSITIQSGGVVDGDVLGGIGNDTITIDGGHVYGNVNGGDGINSITIQSGGVVDGDVLGGTGKDSIFLNATVSGNIEGGAEGDTIILNNGGSVQNVFGAVGNDLISLNGAHVSGNIAGGNGDDSIYLLDGVLDGNVQGEAGSDLVYLGDSFNLSSTTILDGGGDANASDGGFDMLDITNAPLVRSLQGANLRNFETILINNGAVVKFSDSAVTVGNNNTIQSNGLHVFGTLLADNQLTVTGGVEVYASGKVEAGNASSGTPNTFKISSDLRNSGVIHLTGGAQEAHDTLVVDGNYIGSAGSIISSDVDLASLSADQLIVGGSASGATTLAPVIVGANLASDITLVSTGSSSLAGTFTSAQVNKGLVNYDVVQSNPQTWVLRSTLDPVVAGQSIGSYLNTMNTAMSSYRDHTLPMMSSPKEAASGRCYLNPWMRGKTGEDKVTTSGSASGLGFSGSSSVGYSGVEGGLDCGFYGDITVHAGLLGGQVNGDSVSKTRPASRLDFDAPFIGGYLNGSYDALTFDLMYTHDFYHATATDPLVYTAPTSFKGDGDYVRGRVSYDLDFGSMMTFKPMLSLEYNSLSFENFSAIAGNVSMRGFDSLVGRVGGQLSKAFVSDETGFVLRPFIEANLVHEFDGKGVATISSSKSAEITNGGIGTYGTFGIGTDVMSMSRGISGFVRADAQVGDRIGGYSAEGGVRFTFDVLK